MNYPFFLETVIAKGEIYLELSKYTLLPLYLFLCTPKMKHSIDINSLKPMSCAMQIVSL